MRIRIFWYRRILHFHVTHLNVIHLSTNSSDDVPVAYVVELSQLGMVVDELT